MTTRTVTVLTRLALLLAAVVLLTACGGGADKAPYEAGMRKVGSQISEASAAVAKLPPDATTAQRVAAIRSQQRAIAAAADSAEGLEPPSDASKDHAKLVSALHDYADLLGQLAATSANPGKQSELLGQAGDIVKRLTDASGNLEKAGYSFGLATSSSKDARSTSSAPADS
jgi:hypothetical protein